MVLTSLQENGVRRSGCLDAELLASYIDGRTTPEERVEIEAHLARCEDCYFAFSETVQEQQAEGTEPEESEPSSRWHGWMPRAAAGLAAAAAVVIAVQIRRPVGPVATPEADLKIALYQLDAASGPFRTFEPRLTVTSSYRELEPAMRSAAPSGEAPFPVREAALKVEIAATKVGTGLEGHRARAAMYLALGDPGVQQTSSRRSPSPTAPDC